VSRPLALLVNPAAAGGKALAAVTPARAELDRLKARYRVIETASGEHAKREARAAGANGETVIAVGGDGLVGTLAGAICGTDAALGIIPAGRGNDFARVLDIPTDPAQAARTAHEGHTKLLDVGEVDGKSFVGIASVGFDSDANRIANEAKLVKGNLVYAYAALKALAKWEPAHFDVIIDGEHHEVTGYSVGVCNSKAYGGGMYAAPQAELDDGLLDVILCATHTKRQFLSRTLPGVFKGTYLELPWITCFTGKKIEVSSDRPFVMYADGDPLTDLPATIEVRPRSLHVVVPRG
jgi:YegS/Rv2252/BmrU family lipid kinase